MKDQATLADTPFISSLRLAQGANMVKRLKPVLQRHQKKFEPTGSSQSKNPLLLRNCFNIDVYTEFVKRKKVMREQFKTEYVMRDEEVMAYLQDKKTEGRDVAMRIQNSLNNIQGEISSTTKRNKLISLFKNEMQNA